MSVESVIARMGQLQAMMGQNVATQAAPATTSTTNFASALQSAQGATATAASVATGPTYDGATGGTTSLGATTGATTTPATGATGTSTLPAGTPYGAEITAAAQANGIDPALLAGLVKQESGFKPTAGSGAGARGLTQLMPATARGLGVTDVTDPVQSLNGGAKYLKQQLDRFGGDVTRALAAYNAGPGAVQRFGGVPPYPETQNYVRVVQANAAAFKAGRLP